jgi:hypothetical protein
MYATIRTYSGGSDLADSLIAHEDSVRQVISGIQGFRAYYLVRTGAGMTTVSVFDDQAGADASTEAAAAWIRENLPEASSNPPQVTGGEVTISF